MHHNTLIQETEGIRLTTNGSKLCANSETNACREKKEQRVGR